MNARHCDECGRAHFAGDLQNGYCSACRHAMQERSAERSAAAERLDAAHEEVTF